MYICFSVIVYSTSNFIKINAVQRSVKSCNVVMSGLHFVSLEQFTMVTCIMDIINHTFNFPQNNKFIFLTCEHVSFLLHNNLFCTSMELIKRIETWWI